MRFLLTWLLLWFAAACARGDTVYVAGFYGGFIQKFPTNGTGSLFASGLSSPEQMAFDSAGNLYLANYGNSRVLKFATNGASSIFATTPGGANGLAFDKAGNLFVADFDGGNIYKFSSTGTNLGVFASGITHPIVLAFDTASNLLVATYGNVVIKFSPSGTNLGNFISGLNGPTGMAFDNAGNLYISSFWNNSIAKYSPAGTYLGNFATNGLNEPYYLGFDSATNLYVGNFGTNTVMKFTPSGVGSVYGTINSPSSLAVWPGLAITPPVTTGSPAAVMSLKQFTAGQMTLRFTGTSNASYTVLTSTNMFRPMTNWTALGAATWLSNNVFSFTDTHATNRAQFYSVRSP